MTNWAKWAHSPGNPYQHDRGRQAESWRWDLDGACIAIADRAFAERTTSTA
ncbi:hypothetical protein HG717_32390 [Rhodococcus erythropolis]|uniref:hypothetical protein n=1 Tax=Rhodococcus erythropolis TaxID=1833 RepID=UPI001C9AC23D|nr:hypothetical protein [Rhodococcus erythropolis]MBY6388583.1 hypothetical protein [Rhodococcus erythropolis]